MKPGLYRAQFKTGRGAGAGVLYTDGAKLWGGDTSLYYVGTFVQQGDKIDATVRVDRHTPGLASVFGVDRVIIYLDGTVHGDSVTCKGTSPDAPGLQFGCTLDRISD